MFRLGKVNEVTKKAVKSLINYLLPENSLFVAPWGVESKPVNDATSVVADTVSSKTVCVGYIIKETDLKQGESRFYSTDENGKRKCELLMNSEGDFIFSDGNDNATKFNALDLAIKSDIVNHINEELVKIASGITTAGGAYTPNFLEADLSDAKADNIKI